MKKEAFRTGMVIEFTSKDRGLVLGNEVFIFNHRTKRSDGSLSIIPYYDEETQSIYKREISRVFITMTPTTTNLGTQLESLLFNNQYLNCIWERKKPVAEMTLEEVCKRLGQDIKIIKGK